MQRVITRKSEIKKIIEEINSIYVSGNDDNLIKGIETHALKNKIKFPLLEYFAKELFQFIPHEKQLNIAEKIIDKDYIGSYVIAGKVLQTRLNINLYESFAKAVEYLIKGDKWYSCDIISERVFGSGLLLDFDTSFKLLKKHARHENAWVKRGVGVAFHLAVKWGLDKKHIEDLLNVIMNQSTSKNINVQKGFGWALKTISKFHPEIVKKYYSCIKDTPKVSMWYKRKMELGLSYSEKRNKR